MKTARLGVVIVAVGLAAFSEARGLEGLISGGASAEGIRLESSFPPHIDRSSRGASLRYELRVANSGSEQIRVREFRASDAVSGVELLKVGDRNLKGVLALGRPGCVPERSLVQPGGECVIFVDSNPLRGTPQTVKNTVEFETAKTASQVDLTLRVTNDVEPALGPPLGVGIWVAVHHPDWQRGHRRVFYSSDRGEILPGRFAIDFIRVLPCGMITRGDPDRPSDAVGYGDPVLAVADGVIAAVRDGVGESSTISGNRPHDRAIAAGNYVVLALGRGRFATYEHLRPGSVRVHAGEQVQRGATLGSVGFTGDSTGPHLHFHVSDSPEPLGGEGLPFSFEGFTLFGDYPEITQLGRSRWHVVPQRTLQGVRPGQNTVVSFTGSTPVGSATAAVSKTKAAPRQPQ